ncbi:MAG TPA: excisionase family DNA-binding protein [Dehalococcoidia bacterium]|nr:excisionase family DNA-binding protein [Dehalococcoidia bacterium]
MNNQDHLPPSVSVKRAAFLLGIPDDLVRRWIHVGRLSAEKRGRTYSVSTESLERVMRERAETAEARRADLHRSLDILASQAAPRPERAAPERGFSSH